MEEGITTRRRKERLLNGDGFAKVTRELIGLGTISIQETEK